MIGSKILTCSILISALLASGTCLLVQDARTSPLPAAKQQPARSNGSDIDCSQGIEHLVEVCAKPLMNMILGNMEKWPQNEKDVQDYCDSFITTERCIKDVGRKCAAGLHKTIVSVLGSAVQRVRKRECTKNKLPGLLKVTQCVEKSQLAVQATLANVTTELNLIETQVTNVDKKTTAICCMVYEIESRVKALYANRCPKEGDILIRMYRAVLEDVIELICRAPKCNDFLKGYRVPKTKTNEGVISLLLKIVFSLGE